MLEINSVVSACCELCPEENVKIVDLYNACKAMSKDVTPAILFKHLKINNFQIFLKKRQRCVNGLALRSSFIPTKL